MSEDKYVTYRELSALKTEMKQDRHELYSKVQAITSKIEDKVDDLQKSIFKMIWFMESIDRNLSKAVNLEENVIRLQESVKTNNNRLNNIDSRLKEAEGAISSLTTKQAMYAWAITIISLIVPYIIKTLLK